MIKLYTREMKSLSRILTVLLCCAPLHAVYAAPVATTAGSNLTAFNPNNANNNQWANMTNGRYDGDVSAKADFGNCNAVVLRCAQPKCANGGCSDMAVATSIVSGCVKSNKDCAKYGDELVSFMSGQLVASSTAKINEQNMALEQAKMQAEAQAQAAANAQSQQQMAVMQQQMQEMQLQMQQQQEESARQLQEALSQQAAQSQQAINDMKSAATTAAMETEAGISAYQQDAINRGISADILERQKITGQVLTEIENAEVSLKEVKAAMNSAFEYAGCDSRGNNCDGPKRVKKWRELAHGFIDPYNNTIDKVYEALSVAMVVGVDLSQIYMMLDNSCNSWGQYTCPYMNDGEILYNFDSNSSKNAPKVCPKMTSESIQTCIDAKCRKSGKEVKKGDTITTEYTYDEACKNNCAIQTGCQPCTLLKILTEANEVYEGWIGAEKDTSAGNTTVVACASGALDASKFFASRSRRKNGANLVDIDQLEIWINQTEPKYISKTSDDAEDLMKYCSVGPAYAGYIDMLAELEKSVAGKNISSKVKLCVEDAGTSKEASNITDGDCPYINPVYAICDTHPYNLHMPNVEIEKSENDSGFGNVAEKAQNKCISEGYGSNYFCNQIKWAVVNGDNYTVNLCNKGFQPVNASNGDFGCKKCETGVAECNDEMMLYNWNAAMQHDDKVQEIVRLKTTVLSQQLYKQYEYLNATLRRLKTQLEKAVLTSNLEAAGAKSEGSSSGLLGANNGGDKVIVLAGAENCWNTNSPESAYSCIQNNVNLIKSNASTNKQKAAKQLASTADVARQWEIIEEKSDSCSEYKDDKYSPDVKEITKCANALSIAVAKKISEDKRESQKYQYRPY